MILILAGLDLDGESARPAGWLAQDCHLVRAADLSTPGWSHALPGDGARATVAIGGEPVPETAITGVLTRTPGIGPHELPHIVAVDRDYVAAEMSAFLLSWLHALACPVVNRPMPGCLAGPNWRARQWAAAAAAAGLPLADAPAGATTSALTVVGTRCFGDARPALRERSLALARLAKVELLRIRLVEEAFAGADTFPDLSDRTIGDALHDLFDRPANRRDAYPVLRPWRTAQAASASSRATASPIGRPDQASK